MVTRIYPKGLCEDCFWRMQCMYAVDNPDETVWDCYDEDGGLCYEQDTLCVHNAN